jgi:RimJ/RimL family protein N-acetyltransferase
LNDLESFLDYRNDPDVSRYQGWLANLSAEQAKEFIELQSKRILGITDKWVQIALEEKNTGKHIGDCAIYLKKDYQAEFGITLSQPYQGKGFAMEAVSALFEVAFSQLEVHRITGIVDVDNVASINLMDALGLRREGHHLQSFYDVDTKQWRDEYLYAILKTEWINRNSLNP